MTVTVRLLAPILIGIALAIGALTWINFNNQQALIAGQEDTQLAEASAGFSAQISAKQLLAESLATGVSNLPEEGSALYWQDAILLMDQVRPVYQELANTYGTSELNFYLAPATELLQVTDPTHKPEDVSSTRKIVARTISQGLSQGGVEIGPRGLGIYSAVPVIHSGAFLGAVEVGFSLNQTFLKEYAARRQVAVAVYVKHSLLARATPNPNTVPASIPDLDLIVQTGEPVQASAASLSGALGGATLTDRITQNGKPFAVQVSPLKDYSGDTIGVVQIVLSRTLALDAIDASRNISLLWGGAIFLLVALGVYVVTNRSVIRRLQDLNQVADRFKEGDRAARVQVTSPDELGQLGGTFNGLADEIGNLVTGLEERVAERTASLERYSNYMVALQNTTLDLSRRRDVNELLQAVVVRAGGLVGTEHGYVFLLDPETGEMKMRVGIGVYAKLIGSQARSGTGLAGTVWQSGEPLAVNDYQHWSGRLGGAERAALHAVAGVPLKSGAQVLGVIGLAYVEAGRTFGANEVEVLTRFAQFASIALENARLYTAQGAYAEESRQAMERQAALAEENRRLLERAQQAVANLDAVNRRLTREGWQEFMSLRKGRLALASGAVSPNEQSTVAATQDEPQALTEAVGRRQLVTTRENGRRVVAVPIMVRGEVLGSLAIEDAAGAADWNSEEVAALRSISDHLALALDNARLFEQTQASLETARRNAAREVTLADITERMYARTNVEGILEAALQELRRTTGRKRAVAWLSPQDQEERTSDAFGISGAGISGPDKRK
ncbi:MAG: GAF domain-containing protein [Anaerolineae bacterium]